MKAVLFREHGGPDVLEYSDVYTPHPGSGEVLVELKAVGDGYPLRGSLQVSQAMFEAAAVSETIHSGL